jgi:hypothetical protein
VVVVGDFNLPDIRWERDVNLHVSAFSQKFIDTVRDNYLSQMITQCTRVREGQTPSLLDLILTDDDEMIDDVLVGAPLGSSDHAVICFSILVGFQRENSVTQKLFFDKGDYQRMRQDLEEIDWMDRFEMAGNGPDRVEKHWRCFVDIYNEMIDRYVPRKRLRSDFKKIAKTDTWRYSETDEEER